MEPQDHSQTQSTLVNNQADSTFPTQNVSNSKEENKVANSSDTQHVFGAEEKDKAAATSTSTVHTTEKISTTENAQPQNQAQQEKKEDKIENKIANQTVPETKDVKSEPQSQPTGKPVEKNDDTNQSVTRKASQTKEPKSNSSVDDKKDSQVLENKSKKESAPESNDTKPETQTQAKASEKKSKADQSVTRKDSQNKEPKSQESLSENKSSQINTGRSETLTNKEAENKVAKTKSQEVKGKNSQVKSPTSQQNLAKSKKDDKTGTKAKVEEKPVKSEPTLEGAVGSIFNFFSATKNNIVETSSKSADKLEEIVLKSNIVTTIRGSEYQAVTTSDLLKKEEAKGGPGESQKPQRSKATRSQVKVTTKVAPEKPKKVQADKSSTKPDTVVEKPAKEQTARRAISKPKAKPEGSPGVSPVRAKNEVEEQIRLHKIEEIKKNKKVLQAKIDALNDQLFELQKPSIVYHENVSPTQPAFNMEQYKKIQKEEDLQKKKEAQEFAKKMLKERKELEQKKDQRREKNKALMIKEIDVLYQKQLNELDTLKGASSVKTKFENNINKLKDENMFATLEQRKKDLKMVRSFHKHSTANTTDPADQTNGEEAQPKEEKIAKTKSYKKPLYVSPVLDQVLKEDEEKKKSDFEKVQARKNLHKKQVEYGKEVKSSHLPQVHTAKYFDTDDKLTRAIHRSVNMEKNLVRLAGKDGLYSYLDKMKNKYPDLAKPRKDSGNDYNDDEDIKPKKSKAKHHHQRHEEEENNESDDYERNERNHEMEENWDLTDRAGDHEEEPRDSHLKSKVVKNRKGQDMSTPNDSRISERSRQNHSQAKISKRHQVEQKEAEDAEEDNEWEQELKEDQDILKSKIANMLGDIKQMETQIKQKEQALLKDIEKKKLAHE